MNPQISAELPGATAFALELIWPLLLGAIGTICPLFGYNDAKTRCLGGTLEGVILLKSMLAGRAQKTNFNS